MIRSNAKVLGVKGVPGVKERDQRKLALETSLHGKPASLWKPTSLRKPGKCWETSPVETEWVVWVEEPKVFPTTTEK